MTVLNNNLKLGLQPRTKVESEKVEALFSVCKLLIPKDYSDFAVRYRGGEPTSSGFWIPEMPESVLREENRQTARIIRENSQFYQSTQLADVLEFAELLENSISSAKVTFFFDVLDDTPPSLNWLTNNCELNSQSFRRSWIPIAAFNSDLLICMSCFAKTFGRVYGGFSGYAFFMLESEQELDKPGDFSNWDDQIYAIAANFREFVEMIDRPQLVLFNGYVPSSDTCQKYGFSDYEKVFCAVGN